MSRVGRKPITLPKGVKINVAKIDGNPKVAAEVQVEGPKGKLRVPVPPGVSVEQNDGTLQVVRDGDEYAALHGLTRALTFNAVQGVSSGWTRELDIVGTGYRAEVKGQLATFSLGYSHSIEFVLPKGVELKVDKLTHIIVNGFDRQEVGQVAAKIRALRPPDPYKNKGVRYTGEVLRKKAGKTGSK